MSSALFQYYGHGQANKPLKNSQPSVVRQDPAQMKTFHNKYFS